jgi:glycosyltransferase involved in cell wall biosynthesis
VLFEGAWWVDGPPSGRNVLHGLVTTWAEQFDDELLLAVPAAAVARARAAVPRARVLELSGRPQAVAATLGAAWLGRRHGADLVVTQNFAPAFGPGAVFVHDVLYQSNPEWFTRAERAYLAPITRLARRATVLTSSAHEAGRIATRNRGLSPHPVGLGLSDALVSGPARRPATVPDGLDFVLSVGRLNVRKNLARLLEAATRSTSIGPSRPLLVVGEAQGRAEQLSAGLRQSLDDGSVRLLGGVPDPELRWLYQHARLFAFPTLDEGFGLPPLEALANGCPVLASDIPVLREVLGNHAHFVDPRSVDALTAGLDAALASPPPLPAAPPDGWDTVVHRMRAAVLGATREPTC